MLLFSWIRAFVYPYPSKWSVRTPESMYDLNNLCVFTMSFAFMNNINGDCCVALVLVGRELIMVVGVVLLSRWIVPLYGMHEGSIGICLATAYTGRQYFSYLLSGVPAT